MVSNALKMSQEELLEALEQLRKKFANTAEYKKLRQDLPKDWPRVRTQFRVPCSKVQRFELGEQKPDTRNLVLVS